MNSFNLSDLIKVIVAAIAVASSCGKFEELEDWALLSGIKAATYYDYKPTHFFYRSSKKTTKTPGRHVDQPRRIR